MKFEYYQDIEGNAYELKTDLEQLLVHHIFEQGEEIEELKNQLQQKENIIKEVREYIKKDTRWFDSEYASIYGELCDCAGANDTRLEVLVNPSNLLKILDKEVN